MAYTMASPSLNTCEECAFSLPTTRNSLWALVMASSGHIHSQFRRHDPVDSLHGHGDEAAVGQRASCLEWRFESELWQYH
jgi:hypothetical protein